MQREKFRRMFHCSYDLRNEGRPRIARTWQLATASGQGYRSCLFHQSSLSWARGVALQIIEDQVPSGITLIGPGTFA